MPVDFAIVGKLAQTVFPCGGGEARFDIQAFQFLDTGERSETISFLQILTCIDGEDTSSGAGAIQKYAQLAYLLCLSDPRQELGRCYVS